MQAVCFFIVIYCALFGAVGLVTLMYLRLVKWLGKLYAKRKTERK